MNLGAESRNKVIAAAALGVVAVLTLIYEFLPSSPSEAPVPVSSAAQPGAVNAPVRPVSRKGAAAVQGKKQKAPQSLDPMLNLKQLSTTEQIKYEGSGRNIFISQAEVEIPKPLAPGTTGPNHEAAKTWTPPAVTPPPPIPLKFFGFASQPGEPKKIFLSKGEDVFIAGEGEIVDRRYKVVHISTGSVEIQDVVGSGPPQTVPLTQG